MTGSYVKTQRELVPLIPTRCRINNGAGIYENALRIVPETQLTRSWRTRAEGVEQQAELENDLRIFRNGFTSYDPIHDRGHEFLTSRTRWWLSHRDSYITSMNDPYNMWARGPLIPVFFVNNGLVSGENGYDPYPSLPKNPDVVSLGQKAILSTAPTAPSASVTTAVVELLKEALPGIPGVATIFGGANVLRSGGGEYLNIEFGFKPLISDIRKVLTSLRSASVSIQQLQRDSGRQVRRRFKFPVTVDSTESTYSTGTTGPFAGHDYSWYTGTRVTSVQKIVRTERDVWFSGAYTYYVPRDESLLSTLQMYEQRANKLLGTRFDASAFWQISAWSWLIDWKVKIGDALGVASALQEDGLVIRYGYLMVHTIEDHTYNSPTGLLTKLGDPVPNASVSFRRETKQRYRATPYGFGISTEALTPKRIAILTALGLSRLPVV